MTFEDTMRRRYRHYVAAAVRRGGSYMDYEPYCAMVLETNARKQAYAESHGSYLFEPGTAHDGKTTEHGTLSAKQAHLQQDGYDRHLLDKIVRQEGACCPRKKGTYWHQIGEGCFQRSRKYG